uniref:Zinc finger, CCHC-type n=1 Tax=Tanacetum cinerariifolium TaxID=118510 RepID=A0A699HWY9_TANCI|nr:hypothetical protein [Tanacetum cinerariifolium]
MSSMNTRLNIEKLDGNIVQKHGGLKQVGYKQLGPGVEIGVHGVHDEKRVWFEVELQGAQGDSEAEVFQVSNNDTAVAQRRLKDKQPEEKTNTDCLVFWIEDTTRSTYLVNRSPSSAIGFMKPIDMLGLFGWLASIKQVILEPVKVKCIFIGYHKSIVGNKLWRLGTGSTQALHGFEFEVEPLGDHTFEVEPQEIVDQGASLQDVQTQDLIDYQLAPAAMEKIYAHESLTFNNTVACEVISKWNAGLKDNMDARWYGFFCGCKAEIWVTKGLLVKAKGNILGLEIIKDQSVESQEYQAVCTRLYVTSVGVDMLDGFDRGLQTNVQVFVDFDYAMGRSITVMSRSITSEAGYMTFTKAWKKKIWLKGLLTESRYELRLVAGIATGALVKGGSRPEVLAQVEVAAYRY